MRALPLLLLAACSADLVTPSNAKVSCGEDADCPEGWSCNASRRICQEGDTNAAPAATIRAVGRGGIAQTLEVVVSDLDGAPAGRSRVDLTVTYSLDGTTFCPASIVESAAGLEATVDGAAHTLTWDLLTDARAAEPACAVPTADVDRTGTGSADTTARYRDGVLLRVTARDDGTPRTASLPATSAPFAFGDEPPHAELTSVEPSVSLTAPLNVRIADPDLDPADIELCFRLDNEPLTTCRLPLVTGLTTGIASAATIPDAQPSLLVWHTSAPLGTATEAGGVGFTTERSVHLSVRGVDHGIDEPVWGEWTEIVLDVENQTPPVIGGVTIRGGESGSARALVYVEYVVLDREGDLVDVEVEWRHGSRAPWRQATEYPTIEHSGRYDLATAAIADTTILHTFVWNADADISDREQSAELRLRAADDAATSGWLSAPVPFAIGSDVLAHAVDQLETPQVLALAANTNTALLLRADINGDGARDLVAVTSSTGVRYWLGAASRSGVFGAPTDLAVSAFRAVAATGDFNGDGRTDLVVKSRDDDAEVALGGTGGLTPQAAALPSNSNTVPRVTSGDFNGDGWDDIALGSNSALRIYRSNGNGTFTVDGADIATPEMIYALAAGDFDADGADDLAYALPNGAGIGDGSNSVRKPMDIRVYSGIPGATSGVLDRSASELAAEGFATAVDAIPLGDLALGTGDVDGRPGDELLAADLLFVGYVRTRVFSRSATFSLLAETATPGRALAIHWDPVGAFGGRLVVAATNGTAGAGVAYRYDADAGELRLQPGAGVAAVDASLGLFDADDLPDIAVSIGAAGTGSIASSMRHGGASLISSGSLISTAPVSQGARALLAGDLDGDGIADLLAADAIRGSLHAVVPYRGGSHAGRGTLQLEIAADPVPMFPDNHNDQAASNNVGFADVTGDGWLDAVLSAESGSYYVAASTGPFDFLQGVSAPDGTGAFSFGRVLAGDYDGDGRDDVAWVESGELWASRSTGAAGGVPTWTAIRVDPGFYIDSATVGDVDGDGMDDLVLLNNATRNAAVAFGGSAPTYCSTILAAAPSGAAVGDVDGDGANDVLVSSAAGLVGVTVTRAPCGFAVGRGTAATTLLAEMQLADIDGDGTLDVLGTGTGGGVYAALGVSSDSRPTGGFGPIVRLPHPGTSSLASAGDGDRDGVLEVFASDRSALTVSVYDPVILGKHLPWTVETLLGTTDRFGSQRALALIARATYDRPTARRRAGDARAGFSERMTAAGTAPLANGWEAVSRAWSFQGDWLSDANESATGRTLTPRSRLTALATEVELVLPLYDRASPRAVRVVARLTDGWTLDGTALPRTADGRSLFEPVEEWLELPEDVDGDPRTDTGPRFTLDTGSGVVRVFTDRLGVFRAFGD